MALSGTMGSSRYYDRYRLLLDLLPSTRAVFPAPATSQALEVLERQILSVGRRERSLCSYDVPRPVFVPELSDHNDLEAATTSALKTC